jgi:hypothetical protein
MRLRSCRVACGLARSSSDSDARRVRRHWPAAGVPVCGRAHTLHSHRSQRINQKLPALYGLKWKPFTTELPTEAIYVPPQLESFCWRIEHALIREGGFAMIHGDPGTGKSVALLLLAGRLARLPDVTVGAISHPQSNLADLYRELGDIFAVPLRPHNRWAASRPCANAGWRTWRERAGARCCWWTRRMR